MSDEELIAGRYRILKQLAVGGMGETFIGEQLQLRRTVVIKTLKAKWAQRPKARQRFQQEAELAASINHPNIVQVYDFAISDATSPYLVMEYIEGETLAHYAGMPRPMETLVGIARAVLSGLGALHQQGILHRDIKPSNIMLQRPAPDPGHPKLIDFGLARIFDSEEAMRLTRTGQIIGTPGYLAPEQVHGGRWTHGPTSTAWAWCCIAASLGGSPFQATTLRLSSEAS